MTYKLSKCGLPGSTVRLLEENRQLRDENKRLREVLENLLEASVVQGFPEDDEDFEILSKARAAIEDEK